MYTQQQSKTVMNYANWLAETKWDTFSTITYRYDIKEKQNYKIMKSLERYLEKLKKPFNMFWVTEFTNYNYNTHNHMLIKGEWVNEAVESYLRAKNLLYNNVVHYPYEKTLGANYYVTKFIGSYKIEWGVI